MAFINLTPAHDTAISEFARGIPEEMRLGAAVEFDEEASRFIVPFLETRYLVSYPSGEVSREDESGEVPQVVQILLLHYLVHAVDLPVEGRLISFKELPDGFIYITPFTNRAIRPLVALFGGAPEKLVEVGKKLGGWSAGTGDFSVTVPVLPRVQITFVLWEGDDEFPVSGNVLFDATASHHLKTEDYALLPGLVLNEMKKHIF